MTDETAARISLTTMLLEADRHDPDLHTRTHNLSLSAPATWAEVADFTEAVLDLLAVRNKQLREAATERDAYRDAIAGGRAFLGLVMPELVYPARIMQGIDQLPDLGDWKPGAGALHVMPPDPLTVLADEVRELGDLVRGLIMAKATPRPAPKPDTSARAMLDECTVSDDCASQSHLLACPQARLRDA